MVTCRNYKAEHDNAVTLLVNTVKINQNHCVALKHWLGDKCNYNNCLFYSVTYLKKKQDGHTVKLMLLIEMISGSPYKHENWIVKVKKGALFCLVLPCK